MSKPGARGSSEPQTNVGVLFRLPSEVSARLRAMTHGLSLIEGRRVTYGELMARGLDLLDRDLRITERLAGLTGPAAPPKAKRRKG